MFSQYRVFIMYRFLYIGRKSWTIAHVNSDGTNPNKRNAHMIIRTRMPTTRAPSDRAGRIARPV
jgi:hypothetical protein